MSDKSDYLRMAARAEQDLNSYQAKQGLGPKSDSSTLYSATPLRVHLRQALIKAIAEESNINEMVDKKFPESTGVRTGRAAGATGSNRMPIPEDEGGIRDDRGR